MPVRAYLESLTEQIFQNRLDREQRTLTDQLDNYLIDMTKRGLHSSGMYSSGVGRLYGQYLYRIVDQTLEQLELTYRQTGRNDANFYWTTVEAKLHPLVGGQITRLNNAAVSKGSSWAGDGGAAGAASQGFQEYGDFVHSHFGGQIRELKLRSQVITMKSAADRKANNIPDVAVMMWFPDPKVDPENAKKAEEKFAAISNAVSVASKGLATIDKINNPNLVHRDRISPSVEAWLTKSVLVICDLEGNRPNVFYEFGYARATGTHVIAIRPNGASTDFHLAQWNLDEYSDWEDLKNKITPRITTALSNYDLSGSI